MHRTPHGETRVAGSTQQGDEPESERPARGKRGLWGESQAELVALGRGGAEVCGTSHVEGVAHRRVGPRKWAGTAARGRPERRSAARCDGSDETWNGVRPRGVRTASAGRLLGAEPRFAQAPPPPTLRSRCFPQALGTVT